MNQKWIWILVILVFYQKITSGAGEITVQEGHSVDIQCEPAETGTMIIWFRVLDKSGIEYIASFAKDGTLKSIPAILPSAFSQSKITKNILTLKSFNKVQDSGIYTCACIWRNALKFGKVTRLVGAEVKAKAPPATTVQPKPPTSTAACVCKSNNKQAETSPAIFCSLMILGPLAGGCGLLLLLLIITTLYCNHIRTHRCPHHYRRKPRPVAPGKQMMTNRHI